MVGGNDVSGEKLKLHGNYFPGESISSLSLPPLPLSVSLCVSEEKRFSLKVIPPTEGAQKSGDRRPRVLARNR